MSSRRLVPAALALTLVAGCGSDPVPAPAAPVAGPPVPAVVGLPLEQADARLEAAGFGRAATTDALRDRSPLVRTMWQVCTQTPGPGPAPEGTLFVTVTIVQTAETCPGAAGAASAAPTTAPSTPPTTPPTRRRPVPRPTTARATPTPALSATAPEPDDTPGPSGPVVYPGTPCVQAGAVGVTRAGRPMVCRPGGDGRNRWTRS